MQSFTWPNLLSSFSSSCVNKKVESSQSETDDQELLQMLNQQKQLNDLVYIWESDDQGRVNGRWIKACYL